MLFLDFVSVHGLLFVSNELSDFLFVAPVMFYSSNGVILLFFLMLAKNWPEFMLFWDQTESLMECQGFNKTKLRFSYNVITVGVMLMAAG